MFLCRRTTVLFLISRRLENSDYGVTPVATTTTANYRARSLIRILRS